MNLERHIIDTIKEWQLKIGYREGNMKLYYPGESLAELLGIAQTDIFAEEQSGKYKLQDALEKFCNEMEPKLGRMKITGSYERYCLDIPAKGCAYVAGKVPEPKFLKLFLQIITNPESSMVQIREGFANYAEEMQTSYAEELVEDAHAFYFADASIEEYVYWVEENEFGLTYHRFTRGEFQKLR